MLFATPRLSRRALLVRGSFSAAAAAAFLAAPSAVRAQRAEGPAEVPLEDLLRPGPLPELVLGPENAKAVIVEYASMTCGHCANFHNNVFPELRKTYIDTGKVRFILREFPLDNVAAAASMIARCAGGERTFALIETFFAQQAGWAFTTGSPVPKLFDIAKQAGFTKESFDKCLTDQKLLDDITAVRTRAAEVFGVNATPTFFINGKRLAAAPTLAEFGKVLDPLLEKG